MIKTNPVLIYICLCIIVSGCITAIDEKLPHSQLPEITVAAAFNLIASPAHPTAYLPIAPIAAGETVKVIGTDKNAAWLLVLHNNQLGWMPTFYSRTNVGTLKPAIKLEAQTPQCINYLGATSQLSETWVSGTDGALFIIGSVYRPEPGDDFQSTTLTANVTGRGKAKGANYVHLPLTASSAVVLYTFALADLQKDSRISFTLTDPGNELLSFQAAFFKTTCPETLNHWEYKFVDQLPIGVENRIVPKHTQTSIINPPIKQTPTPHTPTPTSQILTPTPTPRSIIIRPPPATSALGPSSTAAAGAIWKLPRYDIPFVYVPGGEFLMGSPDGERTWYPEEHPQQLITVESFWLGQTEVTNAQYRPFVETGGYTRDDWWTDAGRQWRDTHHSLQPAYWNDRQWNQDEYPVVGISWYEAVAYTNWLSAESGLTLRLPTEAEWERAARGGDSRNYPWGSEWNGRYVNFCDKRCDQVKDKSVDDGYAYAAPVGSYPNGASPYGALDMAGNVWEWTSTKWIENYANYAELKDERLLGTAQRVLRGGAWNYIALEVSASSRNTDVPETQSNDLGFRLALSPNTLNR